MPSEFVRLSEMPQSLPDRTHLSKPSSLTPLEAYLGLVQLFGPATATTDDPKQQWLFCLSAGEILIEVYDWHLETWSIAVYDPAGDQSRASAAASALEKQLTHLAGRSSRTARELASAATSHVVENPYVLYLTTAETLLSLAESDTSDDSDTLGPPDDDGSTQDSLCRAAFFQYVSAIEGFLNLIYDIYLRPPLRDRRIVERLGREQLDLKLRLAPVYCACFSPEPIDSSSEALKSFHTIINRRNDFIHANLSDSMKVALIQKDGFTFTVPPSDSDQIVPAAIGQLTLEHLYVVRRATEDVVGLLLSRMLPGYREEFESVVDEFLIQITQDAGFPRLHPVV